MPVERGDHAGDRAVVEGAVVEVGERGDLDERGVEPVEGFEIRTARPYAQRVDAVMEGPRTGAECRVYRRCHRGGRSDVEVLVEEAPLHQGLVVRAGSLLRIEE